MGIGRLVACQLMEHTDNVDEYGDEEILKMGLGQADDAVGYGGIIQGRLRRRGERVSDVRISLQATDTFPPGDPGWITFLLAVFAIGIGFSILNNYFILYLTGLGASEGLFGLSVAAAGVSELPVYYFSTVTPRRPHPCVNLDQIIRR